MNKIEIGENTKCMEIQAQMSCGRPFRPFRATPHTQAYAALPTADERQNPYCTVPGPFTVAHHQEQATQSLLHTFCPLPALAFSVTHLINEARES
jgi:hypothetical protein